MGSPYVPSKQKEIEFILKQIKFKKNNRFVDLGCGDGRVVRTAVKKYQLIGLGVDINPILIFIARVYAYFSMITSNISFIRGNFFNISLKNTDYVYIFLMPDLIKKLKYKLKKELKKQTIVISHGFPIIGWEKKLIKKVSHIPFPTYFYKL
ncbi:MAG: class I SAM-dependent methyltransferase [Candidatus Woesearchaeota archaeon]